LDEDFSAGPAQRVAHPVVTVVDLAEDITLGQGHTISLIINNVGDKYYSEITGYPMPGANYMVRYAYQF
jgi:outer membrane cobalamin receptor